LKLYCAPIENDDVFKVVVDFYPNLNDVIMLESETFTCEPHADIALEDMTRPGSEY